MYTQNDNYRFEEAIKTLVFAIGGSADIPPSLQAKLIKACDEVEEQYDALKSAFDALKSESAESQTVAEQIIAWAEANYSNSHEAQAVVEGCYDTEELDAFGSLAAFKKNAGIRDDYREDIRKT